MSKIGGKLKKIVERVGAKLSNSVSQGESGEGKSEFSLSDFVETSEYIRKASAEGSVLLKNEGILPLSRRDSVAVFGRVQRDWFYVGYGSGGDVRAPYRVNLITGLKRNGIKIDEELDGVYREWCDNNPVSHGVWGHWPRNFEEMPVTEELVKAAAERNTVALVVIGRAAGEDRENTLENGSYYLTDKEEDLLSEVTAAFDKTVVVMDIGNVIDFSFVERYRMGALLIAWQGGMESGNAVADVLGGDVSPSGRLPMTIARHYEDYPSAANFGNREYNEYKEDIYVGYRYFETFAKDAVLYPFGAGSGYGKFETTAVTMLTRQKDITFHFNVKNIGDHIDKETLAVYAEPPQGVLGKPSRVLVAFAKTKDIMPGNEEYVEITFPTYALASYDDTGATGHRSCYVLERGTYKFYLGGDVRNAKLLNAVFELKEDRVVVACNEIASPPVRFERLRPRATENGYEKDYYLTPDRTYDLKKRILENLPTAKPYTGDKGISLKAVKAGNAKMEDFIAELSNKELEAITRGDYQMGSPLGVAGNAGVFGGVLESLRKKGVDPITCSDGPAGIRLKATCSLLPIGTLLASTWDTKLIRYLLGLIGAEMKKRDVDVLLAPGMNIHRDPLCGRNFEYFSEDPLLTGKIAAAYVNGVQDSGRAACPKHFACNNQETNRTYNDSRVSERALREIYLKGFEICVDEGYPRVIMTSYNKINGVWGHYNYDLCSTVLRKEWGYQGPVVTDWWMRRQASPEFPKLCDNAYRVRAGVDVLMPGGSRIPFRIPDGTLLRTLGKKDGITRAEIALAAKHVLDFVVETEYK